MYDSYRWDQSTYWGRARQFFTTTNTMNLFVTSAQLDQAKVNAFSPGGVFFYQGCLFSPGVFLFLSLWQPRTLLWNTEKANWTTFLKMRSGQQNICTTPPIILTQVGAVPKITLSDQKLRRSNKWKVTFEQRDEWDMSHFCDNIKQSNLTGEKMILPGRMSAQVPFNDFLFASIYCWK